MFKNITRLIFDGVDDKTSAKGNPYRIVNIIDPVSYQRLEYFADKELDVNCDVGSDCFIELSATRSGYSTNMSCKAVYQV